MRLYSCTKESWSLWSNTSCSVIDTCEKLLAETWNALHFNAISTSTEILVTAHREYANRKTMRLLRIDSFRLESFYGDDIPPCAFLSQRWGKREMTYTNVSSAKPSTRLGYEKVMNFCDVARRRSEMCSSISTCGSIAVASTGETRLNCPKAWI